MQNEETTALRALVESKCIEVGDCLIWQGRMTSSGYPRIQIAGENFMVRRLMAEAKIGRKLKPKEVAASTCNDPACLCWDHVRVTTLQQRRIETGRAGGYSTKAKGMRISMEKRKDSKLVGGQVAADEIRSDPRPSHEVAPEYGVSPSMVRRIRGGKAWQPIASPFAGLGARS
jgi:hypothetical protein